jgi:hypothetical protein
MDTLKKREKICTITSNKSNNEQYTVRLKAAKGCQLHSMRRNSAQAQNCRISTCKGAKISVLLLFYSFRTYGIFTSSSSLNVENVLFTPSPGAVA